MKRYGVTRKMGTKFTVHTKVAYSMSFSPFHSPVNVYWKITHIINDYGEYANVTGADTFVKSTLCCYDTSTVTLHCRLSGAPVQRIIITVHCQCFTRRSTTQGTSVIQERTVHRQQVISSLVSHLAVTETVSP
jgi:hypothetical protein